MRIKGQCLTNHSSGWLTATADLNRWATGNRTNDDRGGDKVNSKFLGDALDHWKGSLIQLLSAKELLKNLVVEPMITDERPWLHDDIETYGRLLGLESSNQIHHAQSTFSGKREEYFNLLPNDTDLFLDPDTGIATGSAGREHVKANELRRLLTNSDRVVMVYQHSARGSFHQRLDEIRDIVSRQIPNVHCSVYECGRVAVFFMSRNRARIQEICNALKEHLRGTAENRISNDSRT